MALKTSLRVLRQHLAVILLAPLVAAVTAYIVSNQIPSRYDSTAALYVRPSQPIGGFDPGTYTSNLEIENTYAQWMVSDPVLQQVIDELHLDTTPPALARFITIRPNNQSLVLDVVVTSGSPHEAQVIAQTLLNDFLTTVRQAQATQAISGTGSNPDNLVVISPPTFPQSPSSPNLLINVGLALAVGLIAVVGLTLLIEYLDQRIRDDDRMAERVTVPVLGRIPAESRAPRSADSGAAEAYRALRTNLLFATADSEGGKTLVITSPMPGDGKTWTCANLGLALAQAGFTTLIIDADFRHPKQHTFFKQPLGSGLSNLFLGGEPSQAIVQVAPNLSLLTAGPKPPNASELLGSHRMFEILNQVAPRYNVTLVDTPPINLFTDGSVVAGIATGTIVVVAYGQTTYPALERTSNSLENVKAHVLGIVINKTPAAESHSYYYYYSQPKALSEINKGGESIAR